MASMTLTIPSVSPKLYLTLGAGFLAAYFSLAALDQPYAVKEEVRVVLLNPELNLVGCRLFHIVIFLLFFTPVAATVTTVVSLVRFLPSLRTKFASAQSWRDVLSFYGIRLPCVFAIIASGFNTLVLINMPVCNGASAMREYGFSSGAQVGYLALATFFSIVVVVVEVNMCDADDDVIGMKYEHERV